MASACVHCGASPDLDRSVLFEDDSARACMACGAVRVNELEMQYPDNPHVDPYVVAKPVTLDADALAWVSAFPRRTRSGCGFMPAAVRAPTIEDLARAEADADGGSGSLIERLRAASPPTHPPARSGPGMYPFQVVYAALSLSASTPLASALVVAEHAGIAGDIAREHLATRADVLSEVAASIFTLRPAHIAIAVRAARATALPAELAALADAIRRKLEKTDPHSSDVTDLRATLTALAG